MSKVFDWKKAAEIIKERRPSRADAGLSEDWSFTSGTIYENGSIVKDSYTFLSSSWATPVICLYFNDSDGFTEIDCYQDQSKCDYYFGTKWPQEAIDILERE